MAKKRLEDLNENEIDEYCRSSVLSDTISPGGVKNGLKSDGTVDVALVQISWYDEDSSSSVQIASLIKDELFWKNVPRYDAECLLKAHNGTSYGSNVRVLIRVNSVSEDPAGKFEDFLKNAKSTVENLVRMKKREVQAQIKRSKLLSKRAEENAEKRRLAHEEAEKSQLIALAKKHGVEVKLPEKD